MIHSDLCCASRFRHQHRPDEREAGKKEGSMGGGIYMERPKPGEHFFGKGQEGDVLPHVGKALNLPLNAGNKKVDAGY